MVATWQIRLNDQCSATMRAVAGNTAATCHNVTVVLIIRLFLADKQARKVFRRADHQKHR